MRETAFRALGPVSYLMPAEGAHEKWETTR